MIKLSKLPKPTPLVQHANDWTKQAMSYYYSGYKIPDNIISKYGHKEIKDRLIIETHGKCAYCESDILHIDYGDIEHIIPKSVYPRLAFYWPNLTLACSVCNTSKSDYFAKPSLLLNPYKDDIECHLKAHGPMILPNNGSDIGSFTHLKLKLNRKQLIERRSEAIKIFNDLLIAYNKETRLDYKQIYKEQLLEMMMSDKEYSFVLRSFAQREGFLN